MKSKRLDGSRNTAVEKTEVLIQRYADAATTHGRATEAGDYKAGNAAYHVVVAIYGELRRRGADAQQALLPLLSSPEPGARLWAASHALEFSAPEGEAVLAVLSELPRSLVGFTAKITLSQWREGKLRP